MLRRLCHRPLKFGLASLFFLLISQLTGCTVEESQRDDQTSSIDISLDSGADAPMQMELLPMPFRLAFMTGHVRAGIALYRAGELQMAAPHLLHPVSETHAAERVGLDKLGFDSAPFDQVSLALEAKRPAVEIEPLLIEAEANLAIVATRAGGDRVAIIKFLLETIIDEYSLSISAGKLTDIGEYQDAYGFSQVAIDHARELPETQQSVLVPALESLVGHWPLGPVPVDNPTPVVVLVDDVNAILTTLQ
jgi:hypothetical protein